MSAKSSEKKRPSLPEGAGSSQPGPDKRDLDVAIVCGVSDDGQGVDVIRRRGERIEAGTVRRLEQGKPIHGEVVRLRPREQFPMICDVEVEMPAPGQSSSGQSSSGQSSSEQSSSGHSPPSGATTGRPAQVATETYRKNWDAIYGRSKKPGPLLN